MTRLKLYGERNSGTNYVQSLVAANLDVDILRGVAPKWVLRVFRRSETAIDSYFMLARWWNLGWKHAVAPTTVPLRLGRGPVCFVTLVKNPYSWLLSLHRRPYNRGSRTGRVPFEEFLSSPWVTVRRERAAKAYPNPVELWNAKTHSYLELPQRSRGVCLRYETVLENPAAAIETLATQLQVPRRTSAFENVDESTKGETDKRFSDYQRYYLQQQWREQLDARAIELINASLDADVVSRAGYSLL